MYNEHERGLQSVKRRIARIRTVLLERPEKILIYIDDVSFAIATGRYQFLRADHCMLARQILT